MRRIRALPEGSDYVVGQKKLKVFASPELTVCVARTPCGEPEPEVNGRILAGWGVVEATFNRTLVEVREERAWL